MFDWIKKYKKNIIIIVIGLLIIIPFLTHCFFKIKLNNSFWIAEWTAGDFLSYYGSVLAFGATVILSFLALWQNEIIRNESNKHTHMLEEMEKNRSCPFFTVIYDSAEINYSNMKIKIKNITDNIALNLLIEEVNGSLKREEEFHKSYTILEPRNSIYIELENGFLDLTDLIQLKIECKDIYGDCVLFWVQGKCILQDSKFYFDVIKYQDK